MNVLINEYHNNLILGMEIEKEFLTEIEKIKDIEVAKAIIKRLLCDMRKYRDKKGFTVYLKSVISDGGD